MGVRVAGLKVMERNFKRHLDVLNDTLSGVLAKIGGVNIDLETEATLYCDHLHRGNVIELGHSFQLPKHNCVSFLVAVALVLVHGDPRLLLVADVCNNELLAELAVFVCDDVLLAEINKGVAHSAERLTQNEANAVVATNLVHFEKIRDAVQVFSVADDVVVLVVLNRQLIQSAHAAVAVQLR